MKSVLLSVKPQHVANILNGLKTIEVRKHFPSDYVGWVYIYCTKNGNDCYGMPTDLVDYRGCAIYNKFKLMPKGEKATTDDNQPRLNGKVVARFWCDKVEELFTDENGMSYYTDAITKDYELSKLACIDDSEIEEYLNGKIGYAIHITNLEIFNKPKELYEFKIAKPFVYTNGSKGTIYYPLTRAFQSWGYVEV